MANNKQKFQWRTVLGLILLYIAMWYDWQWAWGVLFLAWVLPDLFSGVTYFIEPVDKRDSPVLYWIIIISWIVMSLYSFLTLFFPEWAYYG